MIVPGDFAQQISELIAVIDAASADPNDTNMEAARVAYARGRKIGDTAHARGPADHETETRSCSGAFT